ncbi:hypothetical protein CERSUDRAFT_62036 [Gelatoporia subvermispora B]|uniref:DNA 3'-5' helicase n=1 Tax=Ceriporiopsis subvermispora (strain B) TaxID=914234 RepID=M2RT18_CERS8|nr:hypothetical protein CERSUDRAFT_62036 [Gelatoporia subvermispora B]
MAGIKAQLEGSDAIIQAATGSGKTAIAAGPHLWDGVKGRITIMVCPLLALEEEMVNTFRDEFGLSVVALNSTNGACSPLVISRILGGEYHIILVSPEMLQSRTFINRLLRNPQFTRRVLSVIVDEAHCISHWGANFRKKFASLGIARAFLPRNVPVIAVTATLTARVRKDLLSKLHFAKTGFVSRNEGNHRPNVSLMVRACEYPQSSYRDLDFIIPNSIHTVADIPKTYVYADNIKAGGDIVDHLQSLLRSRNPTLATAGLIRPFNAAFSQEYKREAMAAFRRAPDPELTESLGCNIPDVDLVVQWKLPATLSNWIQRAGRAARGRGRTGLAVLLVERSAYSIDLSTAGGQRPVKGRQRGKKNQAGENAKRKIPKDYAKSHGVNRGSSQGKDEIIPLPNEPLVDLDAVDEGLLSFVSTLPVPCCDICDPSLLDRTRPPKVTLAKVKPPRRGKPYPGVQVELESWRETVWQRDHVHAHYDSTAILDDSTIDLLSSIGEVDDTVYTELLETAWIWWDLHGPELLRLLTSLDCPFIQRASTRSNRRSSSGSSSKRMRIERNAGASRQQFVPWVPPSLPMVPFMGSLGYPVIPNHHPGDLVASGIPAVPGAVTSRQSSGPGTPQAYTTFAQTTLLTPDNWNTVSTRARGGRRGRSRGRGQGG